MTEKQNFEPKAATGASEINAQSRGPEAQASTEKPSDRAEAMTRRLGGKGMAEGYPTGLVTTRIGIGENGNRTVYNVIHRKPSAFERFTQGL